MDELSNGNDRRRSWQEVEENVAGRKPDLSHGREQSLEWRMA